MAPTTRKSGFSRAIAPLMSNLFLLLAAVAGSAQNANDIGTPAESKPGQSTASTYSIDKIETVNMANGNFSLHIPLATVGGRGSASYTIALSYNSKVWSAHHEQEPGNPDPQFNYPPVDHWSATFDDIIMREPGVMSLGSGWSIVPGPSLKIKKIEIGPLYNPYACGPIPEDGGPNCGYQWVLTKLWLMLPDGSQIELRDTLTDGAPARTAADSYGRHISIDRDRGRVWHSTDGSGIIYVADSSSGLANEQLDGWLFYPDGTRLRMTGLNGNCTKMIDRNGNFISFDGSTYTDELGHQVIVDLSETSLTVTVKGYNGVADRVITADLGMIGAVDGSGVLSNLRADFRSLQRPFYSGDYLRQRGQDDWPHIDPNPHTDLFNGSENMDPVDLHTALTSIHLPDGRSFRFRYNQYGEVAEITYPGGGVSQIDYAGHMSSLCEGGPLILRSTLNRQVSQRRALPDGTNVDATTIYDRDGPMIATIEARQGGASGALLSSETHYFLALNSEYRGCALGNTMGDGTGYERWQNAKEYRVEKQTGSGTVVVQRTWEQRAPVVWANDVGINYNLYVSLRGQEQPPNDPRVTVEDTILEDGKMKRVEYGYDSFNNVTSINEYDFGTDGSPGVLLRQTFRTYGSNIGSNYGIVNNGLCYSNLDPSDSSCGNGLASDVTSIIYQRHLLSNETVKDANNNPKAYSELEYDNYASDANHAPLITNAGMIQYDGTQFSSFPYQPRGNVTKATRWAGGSNYIYSFNQYDNAGNVVWSKDPNGNFSTVSYADNFGDGSNPDAGAGGTNGPTFALPTLVTNALGHQARTQYDYTRGVPTGAKDPNNVIGKTEYDLLGRPVRATAAVGLAEQTISEMTYPTASSNVSTASKQMDATRWLASKTVMDGFDRVVTAWQAEDGQHANYATFTIRANTIYDGLGRPQQVSNPYRPANETAVYTTTAYDLAGRVVSVTTPDSAVVSSYYNGNQVLVRDQAGKERMSQTNALGQLSEVWEITAADDATESISFPNRAEVTAGYRTKYDYDTLGNLITVTQRKGTTGTIQTRSFSYNPLSRLTSATNPESGAVGYEYDNNGNLSSKTDARPITTAYVYDALNRVTARSYSDGTPSVTYAYDSTGISNGKGRLASVSSSVSSYNYGGYDSLGRANGGTQTIGAQSYPVGYTYDKAGHVLTETYPSGRTVTNAYDNAGRTSNVAGNLGDGAAHNYATGITYDAGSRLTQEQFGTAIPIYNKLFYNSRGQLSEIREGLTPNNTNWELGAIINHYSNNCWGMCSGQSMTDNNGNLKKQEVYIPNSDTFAQFYEYDSLNRLQSVREDGPPGPANWQQAYVYDRYGNRTIDQANTYGTGIPEPNFTVNTANNRLSGQSGTMSYDAAGNLTTDTYSAVAVTRVYDAENRMTKETQANSYVAGIYSYDGDGRRVKRNVGGVETWQVYGIGGELLAEYPLNGSAASPQKEYGYRNGQLLITATTTTGWGAPPVLNDNPLNPNYPGETTVQARHITELRDAINALRSHMSLSAYSWQYSATTNDWISPNPILEMRTALDQALGAPSPSYASGLAQGQPVKAIHIQELRDRVLAAWSSGSSTQINWLVSDQLGTPRMIFDQTGSLANVSRHDYLPFGEELFAGTGGRTSAQGYTASDSVRQKFTQKERDIETGLDFFEARYYASAQGRFTSTDPFNIVLERQAEAELNPRKAEAAFNAYLSQPQQWNRYSYAINNPLLYVDPTGEAIQLSNDKDEREAQMQALREALKEAGAYLYVNEGKNADGTANYYVGIYDQNPNGDSRSFEQVNEVAGEFGAVIRDQQVVTLELVGRGNVTDDNNDTRYIGPASKWTGNTPAVTGYFKGRLTIKMLDWRKHDIGYLPGELMSNGADNMLTPSVMQGHEIGHARARMTRDRASRDASLRLENKIRKLQFPNGPTRKIH